MFRKDKKCPNKRCGVTFERSRFDTYQYCPHCGSSLRGPKSGVTIFAKRDGGTYFGVENVVDLVICGNDGRPKWKISESGKKSKFDKFLDDHEAGLSVVKED